MFLNESFLLSEEIEKYFPLPNEGIYKILKVYKEISIRFTTKIPSVSGCSQSGVSFSEYILCYILNIKLNIEYIENAQIQNLMLVPITFNYVSYIPLKDIYETPKLNPKINDLIIEILDDASLYVYIKFAPY